jgi:hypothetical protein
MLLSHRFFFVPRAAFFSVIYIAGYQIIACALSEINFNLFSVENWSPTLPTDATRRYSTLLQYARIWLFGYKIIV